MGDTALLSNPWLYHTFFLLVFNCTCERIIQHYTLTHGYIVHFIGWYLNAHVNG